MEDFGVKLHPVKKIQLWQTIKKTVFGKMDNNVITPERADEILGNIREKITQVNSPEQAKEFYLALPQMYRELAPVTQNFIVQESRAMEQLLALFLDVIIDEKGIDSAGDLMERMHDSDDQILLIQEFQVQYPDEFRICLQRFSQKFA